MKVRVPAYKRARIEMLPLIDIVFLLLVFFIYAMLSMAVHRGLPVLLPKSTTAEIDGHLILSVTVQSDGSVFLDQQRIDFAYLGDALKRRAGENGEPGVLLFADRKLAYQKLFGVLDKIRRAGLTRISLQAEMDRSP